MRGVLGWVRVKGTRSFHYFRHREPRSLCGYVTHTGRELASPLSLPRCPQCEVRLAGKTEPVRRRT